MPQAPLFESSLHSLALLARGKVRDIYAVDEERLLIVASDRLSAFDVVLPDPIPDKGRVLTAVSNHWFGLTRHLIANHLTGTAPEEVVDGADERAQVTGRAVVVRRVQPLPIEAVVRGYLIGSGWKDYRATGAVCGLALPAGLALAQRLPEPLYTPASKAAVGEHDENITFEDTVQRIGADLAERVRAASLALYRFAVDHAAARGIIIADTKFEFGLAGDGELLLIDEALTPDSSRFWPAASYRPGVSPPSFDKQFVRDWLETLDWDKRPPAPHMPPEVIDATAQKYRQALRLLTGRDLDPAAG